MCVCVCVCVYHVNSLYTIWPNGRVFANSPGDWSSMPGRVIPKTKKWNLMPPSLTLSIKG